jgi:hypothetical protein
MPTKINIEAARRVIESDSGLMMFYQMQDEKRTEEEKVVAVFEYFIKYQPRAYARYLEIIQPNQ